jgi:hypothetical protein
MPREDARARAIGRYVEAEVPTATITTGPQGSFHCYGSRQRVVIIDVAFGRFQNRRERLHHGNLAWAVGLPG